MIRFAIGLAAIAAHLTMLAVGGFLCFAGATFRLTSLSLHRLLAQPLFDSGPSAGELLARTAGSAQLWLDEVTAQTLTFGFLLVGLGLVHFGFRGLWRRLQLGLGETDETLAQSRAERTGRLLFYGIALAIGLLGLVLGLLDVAGPARLYASGQKTTAVIERVWHLTKTEGPIDSGAIVSFVFETEDGERVEGSVRTPAGFALWISEGDSVELLYDPADPSISLFPGIYYILEWLVYFTTRVFLIWLGLSGLRRKLKHDRR